MKPDLFDIEDYLIGVGLLTFLIGVYLILGSGAALLFLGGVLFAAGLFIAWQKSITNRENTPK